MTWAIHEGDCRDVLRTLPAASIHTVVTSPPYFGLRDYGTSVWEGGNPACDHRDAITHTEPPVIVRRSCPCGAIMRDRQIGLEPTPGEFVAALVGVFREVRRVLRDDGTVWLNLGDSYAGNTGGAQGQNGDRASRTFTGTMNGIRSGVGLKPKDLIGIPWMVASARCGDGWYLRSEIIWAKPNPMPESVRDRPTKAHEQLFLLSKSPRYFYDADAIRAAHDDKKGTERFANSGGNTEDYDSANHQGWVNGGGFKMKPGAREYNPAGRNKRSVWTVATQPYAGAHFATFPPKLIEPCILAGCPERCCSECAAPWERVVEREQATSDGRAVPSPAQADYTRQPGIDERDRTLLGSLAYRVHTLGFEPSCSHNVEPMPGTVLDPFAGAGTTGMVALRHGRSFVGIELNPEYAAMARERIETDLRLGFRAPKTVAAVDGQASMFDADGLEEAA